MVDTFDPETVTWVLDEESLEHLCGALASTTEVFVDLETTGLDEHATREGPTNGGIAARVVLASFTLPQEGDAGDPTTWVLPLSHPESPFSGKWRRVLRRTCVTIRDNDRSVSNQNMKFDSRWIKAACGVDLSHLILWDTQISSHLLDENASTKLKERAPATFEVRRWDDFDLTYPGAAEQVPMFDLGIYAARDTYWTWRLAQNHRSRMFLLDDGDEPQGPDEVEDARLGRLAVWVAMPTVATLTAAEQRGMCLDTEWVKRELAEHDWARDGLETRLVKRYPWLEQENVSFAATSNWFRAWADAAVAAGDLTVAELTPSGKPRWSKGVLTRQARTGSQAAKDLLDYRGHTKKAEYLRSWLNYVTPEGRIHTTYHAGRVVTGRLSSSDPNMQQVTAALKGAFVPSPGYYFADFDYSQIEMRVAAHVSRCQPMIEAFRHGEDLHRLLASRITGKPPEEITAEERQKGKSANFGLLYGMGPYGFREYAEDVYGVVLSLEEAVVIHRAFFEMWDGIADWHAQAVHRARQTGQVVSPIGRVRRVPDIWDGNESVAGYAERAAINSPVQGFASDLMQMAAARIEGTLPGSPGVGGARIVGTVHDSVLVEVPQEGWKQTVDECRELMTDLNDLLERLGCELDVPLAADVKVGTRWGLDDVR